MRIGDGRCLRCFGSGMRGKSRPGLGEYPKSSMRLFLLREVLKGLLFTTSRRKAQGFIIKRILKLKASVLRNEDNIDL
jgi:hypothetical protein